MVSVVSSTPPARRRLIRDVRCNYAVPEMNEDDTESDRASFGGMTVNERLIVAGILDQFDDAVRRRDQKAMLAYLRRVAMTDSQAVETTDTILANPSSYGL